jgi:hypothetical protein
VLADCSVANRRVGNLVSALQLSLHAPNHAEFRLAQKVRSDDSCQAELELPVLRCRVDSVCRYEADPSAFDPLLQLRELKRVTRKVVSHGVV